MVPRRTNLFQDVVAIIHRHMAGEATVEESAFLLDSVTGDQREVDVVIRGRTAGHDVAVSVEATAKRPQGDSRVGGSDGQEARAPTH